ncbi:hypothetical protein CTAYLR_003371 [Chrysophaeum taylorii]|uniref:t-SNARE coiled-coil homology domain-containing protein n=1 Tax=Chrysophaeum taylorii TaxID=2483200 RepID=A0AAD7UG48_9STRA|nr:hypothetical protein CTAYLR_003371 [Chrysophaeum taylorii]
MARRSGNASSWFGGSTTKARATQSDLLELQNNEQLDALSEQVSMLKSLTMEIDTEVREQNTFLENMGATFSGAGEALGKTMTALDAMAKRSGAKFAVAILAIIVLLFLLVWWAFKYAHPS